MEQVTKRKYLSLLFLLTLIVVGFISKHVEGFACFSCNERSTRLHHPFTKQQSLSPAGIQVCRNDNEKQTFVDEEQKSPMDVPNHASRRDVLWKSLGFSVAIAGSSVSGGRIMSIPPANAAVGSLPELADTNAILQGLTINVADQSQQDAMIAFLENGFDFQVLRKRIRGTVEETWLGFGPEELNIPSDFTIPVSSFGMYGGHASICVRYDSLATSPLYRIGDKTPPGDNIAYVQVGVPSYRISQMVKTGGEILDAYGIVNVISPSGLPFRGIVGIRPDPMMFIAINCENIQQSKLFYEQLGFAEEEYPYARPNNGMGQFEAPQPPNSVYLSPSKNCMGILLLPTKVRRGKSQQVTVNPVLDTLRIVYTASSESADSSSDSLEVVDPSGVKVSFQSVNAFEREERITR